MKAKQIWELVKDWPQGACPLRDMVLFRGEYIAVDDGGGRRIDEQLAAHAFVGSGIQYLMDANGGNWAAVAYMPNGDCACNRDMGRGVGQNNGPTLLHAVSAAVLAAKGGVS